MRERTMNENDLAQRRYPQISTSPGCAMMSSCPATARSSSAISSASSICCVRCDKCERDGCYGLSRLIDNRGRDGKVIDWLDELTADCPKKQARNMNDPCGARCQDLARVLWCALSNRERHKGNTALKSRICTLCTGKAQAKLRCVWYENATTKKGGRSSQLYATTQLRNYYATLHDDGGPHLRHRQG
jgi:hypothetical protein